MSATTCPVSREVFRQSAKPVQVTLNGIPLLADAREFSTGSLGWYCNGKVTLEINGVPCKVQIGLNLTLVGSKELSK